MSLAYYTLNTSNYKRESYNQEGIFSVTRTKDLACIVHAISEKNARELAFKKTKPMLITLLKYKALCQHDTRAFHILKEFYNIHLTHPEGGQ